MTDKPKLTVSDTQQMVAHGDFYHLKGEPCYECDKDKPTAAHECNCGSHPLEDCDPWYFSEEQAPEWRNDKAKIEALLAQYPEAK